MSISCGGLRTFVGTNPNKEGRHCDRPYPQLIFQFLTVLEPVGMLTVVWRSLVVRPESSKISLIGRSTGDALPPAERLVGPQ